MTKVTIEIEDVGDERACTIAIRKLYSALKERHGEDRARTIWNRNYHPAYIMAWSKLTGSLCKLSEEDQKCLLEYYAAGVSKRKFINGRGAIKIRPSEFLVVTPTLAALLKRRRQSSGWKSCKRSQRGSS